MNGLNADPGWRCACVDVVELVALEAPAADERQDRAVLRPHRDERGLRLRQLRDLPASLGVAGEADHRAGPDPGRRRRLVAERAGDELEAVARDLRDLAVGEHRLDLGRRGLRHDGRRRGRRRRSSRRTPAPAPFRARPRPPAGGRTPRDPGSRADGRSRSRLAAPRHKRLPGRPCGSSSGRSGPWCRHPRRRRRTRPAAPFRRRTRRGSAAPPAGPGGPPAARFVRRGIARN